jgi:hypothetical protein
MGNCMSSGNEQNFAEQQRVRALAAAAAAANGPRGYPAPGQQPHAAPAAPNGPTAHYAVPPQTQQANGAAPATFNPMTGTAPKGGPTGATGAFSPPTSPPAGHFPPGAMSPGAVPPGGMATGPLSPGATPAGGMPPSYFPPGASAAGGGPTIANDPIMNGIHGSGSIARKAGEVLIISYDLGTTACEWDPSHAKCCHTHYCSWLRLHLQGGRWTDRVRSRGCRSMAGPDFNQSRQDPVGVVLQSSVRCLNWRSVDWHWG